jgi:hypothetical protein
VLRYLGDEQEFLSPYGVRSLSRSLAKDPFSLHHDGGTVTVEYDGGVVKAYPKGSVFMEATGTYHNGRNLGNEPVLLLTVSIGAEGIENTVARP